MIPPYDMSICSISLSMLPSQYRAPWCGWVQSLAVWPPTMATTLNVQKSSSFSWIRAHIYSPPPEIVMHHNLALPLKSLLIIRFSPRCVKGLLSFGPHTYSHAYSLFSIPHAAHLTSRACRSWNELISPDTSSSVLTPVPLVGFTPIL